MIIRICLVKTLLGKTLMKEKLHNILLNFYDSSIKTLSVKPNETKPQ